MKDIKYDNVSIDAASDNRDFKVFAGYNGDNQLSTEQLCKPTQSTNKVWVQLYGFILNIMSAAVKGQTKLASLVSEARAVLEHDDTKEKVTAQEYSLACYIVHLADALALIGASKTDEATEKLNLATSILQEQCEFVIFLREKKKKLIEPSYIIVFNVEPFSESNITWDNFHHVSIVLEVRNFIQFLYFVTHFIMKAFSYNLVFTETINRSLGLNSKDARRRAVDSAQSNPLVLGLVKLQDASKLSMQKMQNVVNTGKALFRAQLQKKLYKEITDSDRCIAYLGAKEGQNLANSHIKVMVLSWSQSVTALSEEIDRRLQKL